MKKTITFNAKCRQCMYFEILDEKDEFLSEKCYPVSERQLKKYPEWYEFFNNYIKSL